MNHTHGGKYYIKEVSAVTGLSKQVIRKWEERYDIIQPVRHENGYRLYSERDINILLTIKSLQKKGFSIKQAATEAKERLVSVDKDAVQTKVVLHSELNSYVIQLIEIGYTCNELELLVVLKHAYHFYGLEKFLTSVVSPFLKEVGDRWESGEWDEYQESVSSMVVKDFLVQIRRNFQYSDNASLVLGACLPHEYHEIPVHYLLLRFMLRGWKTTLIGASPAPGSIQSLVTRLKPRKVLLSASTTLPFEKDPELLSSLDSFAAENKRIEFYLGGAGAIQYTKDKTINNIYITNSIEEILLIDQKDSGNLPI
ncbi:MerR family transcriptional regulator [Peribacillus muralis]|uniref:MerR family transcriptional regulator n=1 Tax=Peribacillus muralis TaxID=264697 RepID=UPI00070E91A3|nr:MerR family transcriptional regulator [Peribacillus muralis]